MITSIYPFIIAVININSSFFVKKNKSCAATEEPVAAAVGHFIHILGVLFPVLASVMIAALHKNKENW